MGKSTLVRYFNENPIKDWTCLDFDEGGMQKPETKDLGVLGKWVNIQRDFWLNEVLSDKYANKNVVLFGVGLFPWKVTSPERFSFAYIYVDQDIRKERLISRGDQHLWEAYQKDIRDIVERLNEAGITRFDNSNRVLEETANEIENWLNSLSKILIK